MAGHPENPWQIDQLDLSAYLTRVGLAQQPPSLAALGELHTAHVRTFPFENVDVLLRQHRGVALADVQEKFVQHQRGGYCFEHGTLLAAVLERLGYDVRRRLARVGDARASTRTHLVLVVTVDGERYLADPGFGMSVLRPIRLQDGFEEDQDGWRFRVNRVTGGPAGPGWALHRQRSMGWDLMHTTDDEPVLPVDLAMGHHWTSTHPSSHFTTGLRLQRHDVGGHRALSTAGLTTRVPGQETVRRSVTVDEVPGLLRDLGVELSPGEEARLVELWPTLQE